MIHEDLTTFIEVDPNNYWSQTTTRNTGTTVKDNDNSYVYKDYGVNYFGDYIHDIDIKATECHIDTAIGLWAVTNNPNSLTDLSNGQGVFLNSPEALVYNIYLWDFGNNNNDAYVLASLNTTYYLRIQRNGSTTTCKIYPTAGDRTNDTNVIDTLTITSQTTALRYLQAGMSRHGVSGVKWASGYSENFDVGATAYQVELEDIIYLSDNVELNISREKVELGDTISLSDEISFVFVDEIELEDTINLSDEIYASIIQKKVFLNDVISLSDNIESTATTITGVIKDLGNIFSSVLQKIYDVTNDIRTRILAKYNISNDFRMIQSWQSPGDAGFASLGKEYIKVYIGGAEQTDVDVDSITITKILNGSHTASIDLGRAYDASKPSIESSVEIKYHIWTLYKGYIVDIVPANTPESIRIICRDYYWKNNKSQKYFFIGHKPQDEDEKYYNKISEALSTELSWSPGIGNFIPQTINCFGLGSSDCVTSLVTSSGNFAWFYDVNGTKKLWTAGRGSVINLERQEVGKNLGLYQVLRHQFRNSISTLVNKLRVQMGDLVIRRMRDGRTKEYTSFEYRRYIGNARPAWSSSYETLAKDSISGYGWDYHDSDDNNKYKDVFTKYNLPSLSYLEEWTDRYEPVVEIRAPYIGDWLCSIPLDESFFGSHYKRMKEGFTLDYENGHLIFNQPVYLYHLNSYGEVIDVKAPLIVLHLWKKRYYTNTDDPSDDPEQDITHPLMFFTSKWGSYPETIMKTLILSSLSIQRGGWHISGEDENGDPIWTYIPSWDDTDFAKDYADWQVSKTCDEKISGSVDMTIDAMVFYNINLAKRIMIDGVITTPLNIVSITYNISSFIATIQLESARYYKRAVSLQWKGD